MTSTLSDDALAAEMRAGLEGATPGPWASAGGYVTVRDPDGRSFTLSIYHLDEMGQQSFSAPFQAVPFARHADAAHVARCHPSNIRLLLDAIDTLRRERDEARADRNAARTATMQVTEKLEGYFARLFVAAATVERLKAVIARKDAALGFAARTIRAKPQLTLADHRSLAAIDAALQPTETPANVAGAEITELRALAKGRRALGINDAETEGDGEQMATLTVPLLVLERALSTLPQSGAGEPVELRRVRHRERGTEYEVLGEAEAQISRPQYANARYIAEGDKITVYRSVDTGKLWCRFPDEFTDGRFEDVAPALSPVEPAEEGKR